MEKLSLEQVNHWWISNKVDPELALPFKREVFLDVNRRMKERFIIALIGLRRVGKTTIAYQLIEKLLEEGIKKENILFYSFDEIKATFGEVLESYKEAEKKDFREEKVYIFLDEIQKCNNWENEMKKYYDIYPKIKFVITGSESLFIRKKTKETLAGRIAEFMITPFRFTEYLKFNNVLETEYKYETKINPLFIKYVENGGFPETFRLESEKDFKEYIQALVIDRIIYKDIPQRFKIEEPELLRTLLQLITYNPGMYIDYQSLSKQFEKDRRVIKSYISYLQESFLIRMLGNYRRGSTTLRKKKRAYPTDNGIIKLYKTPINSDFFGRMVETAIINSMDAKSFWKNGNELDIIHNDTPIEIKYQEKINNEDFKTLKEFMRKFGRKEAYLITKKDEGKLKVDEGIIKMIPAWKWLLK
ncbi:ATP-binding protein [Candidatus Pacearchaeota archaeon]|nr:ATP-binding protein [Candidatus Pacearchaeota archaeon]